LFSLHKISVYFFLIILSLRAPAQNPYTTAAGAREAGMAGLSVAIPGFWSSFQNQALVTRHRSIGFGFNYENRFSIKELGTRSAAMIIPAGKASLGVKYSGFGYTDFKREMAGLACGLPLSSKISAGVQIDYLSERTADAYHNIQFLTCEAGVLFSASDDIVIGIHVFNPVPNSLRKNSLPSGLSVGVGSDLSGLLFTGAEVEMLSGMKPDLRAGLEYEAGQNFILRGGFRTATSSFSFGFGYLAGPSRIDIAFSTHERLGITSSVSLVFEFNKK
jgi:hypothetical protein